MYKYTLKPYLRQKMNRGPYRFMEWEFVNQLMKDNKLSGYDVHITISAYSDVVFYSKKKLLQVPAANGILLPVALYDEVEI